MILQWLHKREHTFYVVTGLAEGILTALILAAGRILEPAAGLSAALALKIGIAAGCPETVVFFAAEYARQRDELLRIELQLNVTERGRLAASRLGRDALRDALGAALLSGTCAFGGACVPLMIARLIPDIRWAALAVSIACLLVFGLSLGYATRSCKTCWAAALAASGLALAAVGAFLHVL